MSILNKDFSWCVDTSYDRVYNCVLYGCESICRCSAIENVKITDIEVNRVIQTIYDIYFGKTKDVERDFKLNSILYNIDRSIYYYIVDRVSRYYKLWSSNSWSVECGPGYYGEEVRSVKIEESITDKLKSSLDTVINTLVKLDDKINYLLELEYGYLLPDLIHKSYQLRIIRKSDLIFGNKEHFERVNDSNLDYYNDYNYQGIRAILLDTGNGFKVIDGYHRIAATEKDTITAILAV